MANFNLNQVIIGGRLVRDAEIKTGKSNGEKYTVATFSVAVSRPDGESADFIRCVAFGKKAEFVDEYFSKGSSICVIGHIKTDKYEDDEGVSHYITDVVADVVKFVDSKNERQHDEDDEDDVKPSKSKRSTSVSKNTGNSAKTSKTGVKTAKKPRYEEIEDDEDLPF